MLQPTRRLWQDCRSGRTRRGVEPDVQLGLHVSFSEYLDPSTRRELRPHILLLILDNRGLAEIHRSLSSVA